MTGLSVSTVGQNLKISGELEEHKLGETTFTHFADGTAHKNRMQGNDFVQSVMYNRGVNCFSCHDVHGTDNNADLLLKPATSSAWNVTARLAERTAHGDSRRAHASQGGQPRQRLRRRVTCRKSNRRSRTSTSAATRSASLRPR